MKKNLLIFDLDGTLINSKKDIINSFNHAFKLFKVNSIDKEYFLNNASLGSRMFIKNNLHLNDLYLIDQINKKFKEFYKSNCLNNTRLKIGVKSFLEYAKKNNDLIISTNKNERVAKKIVRSLNVNKYFSQIFGFDSCLFSKPDKGHFEYIIKKFTYTLRNIYLFGDSEVDEKFSINSGINFILIKNGYTKKSLKDFKCYKQINSFWEAKDIIV